MVSSFNFWNKLNLLAAVLILLCLIIYSICLYALVYTFTSRKSAKVLLNNSQYMGRSFVWEEFSRVTRNLIRSFFHGFFIFNYKMQIVGLAWSNILNTKNFQVYKLQYAKLHLYIFYGHYRFGYYINLHSRIILLLINKISTNNNP